MSVSESNLTNVLEEAVKNALVETQSQVEKFSDNSGNAKSYSEFSNQGLKLSPNTPLTQTLQPYTQKLQIITEKVDNKLKIAEYILEYINTGDTIKIVVKAGSNILNSVIFTKGVELSKDIASIILQSTIRGKTPLGIAIFVGGSLISYFFAEEIEELAKELFFGKNNILYRFNKKIEDFFTSVSKCSPSYQLPNGDCAPSAGEFF